jgi:F-type H+-transporting ATPase subunit b
MRDFKSGHWLALWLFAATPAVASEAVATGEAAPNPFAGDIGVALWTLVIFGLVVFILGKFAWPAILSGLQEREEFIANSLAAAKRDRVEAEARLKEYTDRLTQARAEATAIVDESRRDAEAVKRRIEEETHAEAGRILERAKREIGIAKDTALKELYTASAQLTTELAAKVLRREINPQDHERLIRDSIAALAEKKPN